MGKRRFQQICKIKGESTGALRTQWFFHFCKELNIRHNNDTTRTCVKLHSQERIHYDVLSKQGRLISYISSYATYVETVENIAQHYFGILQAAFAR
jgi:hypothetical protein